MISRFLLAFSLVSILTPVDTTVLTSTMSLHKGTPTTILEKCDPINNPRSCPRVEVVSKGSVRLLNK